MKITNIIISVFLSLCLQNVFADAQDINKEQLFMELHQDITRGNVELTKEVHQYYWELLKEAYPRNYDNMIQVMRKVMSGFGKDFGIETWLSAKLTNENGQIIKTQKFIDLELSFIHELALAAGYEKGTKGYELYVAEKNINKPLGILNANRIINAAITNGSFVLDDGSEIHVTTETINSVIENFKKSESIANKLLNEKWSD